jgi:hypothetical protein
MERLYGREAAAVQPCRILPGQARFRVILSRISIKIFTGASMTVPPGRSPDAASSRRHERRFMIACIVVVILMAILLAVGLELSLNSHRALCPPGDPDCGELPPTAPPAVPLPPGTPPR